MALGKPCVEGLVQSCWHSASLLVRAACKKPRCWIWFTLRQVTNLSHSSVDHPAFIVWVSLFYGCFPKQCSGVWVQKRQGWEGTVLLSWSTLILFLTLSLENNSKLNHYKIHIIVFRGAKVLCLFWSLMCPLSLPSS